MRTAALVSAALLGGCVHGHQPECPKPPAGRSSIIVREASSPSPERSYPATGSLFIQVFRTAPEGGELLRDVAVTLHSDLAIVDVNSYIRGGRTDRSGTVLWDSVPVGTYALLARRVGSEVVSTTVAVRDGYTDSAVIALRPMPICLRGR